MIQRSGHSHGQALAGVFCFFGLVAMFSSNLRAVNWRTIGWGLALQFLFALFALLIGLAFCFGGWRFFMILLPLWGFVIADLVVGLVAGHLIFGMPIHGNPLLLLLCGRSDGGRKTPFFTPSSAPTE